MSGADAELLPNEHTSGFDDTDAHIWKDIEFVMHVNHIVAFKLFLVYFTYQMSIIVFLLIKKYEVVRILLLGVILVEKLMKEHRFTGACLHSSYKTFLQCIKCFATC